ncbi:CPBP family intramembrane metalloprotease [Gemmata sp. JC673]|uniref:CPBP family intramembrane metalloprotease n=1 Tax=Gemmata algarum TaxID=2975278 RepID=A0ABU5F1T1_9BACT|nr:CPBP family intramembrane glutamic endopeptidase [Gemmata algarum]MDY3561290.1 CPBP family intramembrane metalloprotease [Gemmata algarum]
MTNDERGDEPLPPKRPRRRAPSVGPAFVAFVVAVALTLTTQLVAGMAIGVWYVVTGGNAKRLAADLPDLLADTPIFVALNLVNQLALLATAIAAARIAPVRPRGGLGFVRPALTAWGYPVLAIGSLVPLAVGVAGAEAVSLVAPPDETFGRAFEKVTPVAAVPFVLFIALVPGLIEEAFFRGYVQRRLLARWPAWAAIATTAGLFGLIHIYPANIVFAFLVGLWLGAVAWRTGSVWPAVLCHASINAASSVWNLGTRFGVIPADPPNSAMGIGGVLALVCFLASVRLLARDPSKRAPEAAQEAG